MAQVESSLQLRQIQTPLSHRQDRPSGAVEINPFVNQTEQSTSQQPADPTRAAVNDRWQSAGRQTNPVEPKPRLIIALDFGTTYSSVAYARIHPSVDRTRFPVGKIRCIANYPHAQGSGDTRVDARADSVPTKLLYLLRSSSDQIEPSSDDLPEDNDLSATDVQPVSAFDIRTPRRRKKGKKVTSPGSEQIQGTIWSRTKKSTVYWGFDVQELQSKPELMALWPEKESVELIKLTLGEDPGDAALRDKREVLEAQVERLIKAHAIPNRDHLLYAYLVRLLRHAKTKLEVHLEDAQLEYVLCVPVIWTEAACRIMHDAMLKAIRECELGDPLSCRDPDLFIVSEPEAAAQYVIASLDREERLRQGEIFIILDAGGGTVDITAYKVASDELGPLRLDSEVLPASGALCGSSLITERYRTMLRAKLKALDPNGTEEELDGHSTALANHWDLGKKRRIDVANRSTMGLGFLSRATYKGQQIVWTEEEICAAFEPSLRGATDLLENHLGLAREENLIVSKVILVGGFGESPSLRARVKEVTGEAIEVISPEDFPTSAVVRGALLRALDKRNGPSRISRSSFGFLRHEQYDPEKVPEQKEAEEEQVEPIWKKDVDREKIVRDTIYWVIDEGTELHSQYQSDPIQSYHAFELTDVALICLEVLFVSQRRHRSHFHRNHTENDGASELGRLKIDMSRFRDEFPLVEKADADRLKLGNRYNRVVEFDLLIEIEGKRLKYEARWPAKARRPQEVRIRESGYVSLVPSFRPGTE